MPKRTWLNELGLQHRTFYLKRLNADRSLGSMVKSSKCRDDRHILRNHYHQTIIVRSTLSGVTTPWKDREIKRVAKVKLVKLLVHVDPISLYGADNWAMRKIERNTIDVGDECHVWKEN